MNADAIHLTTEQLERLERAALTTGKRPADLLNGLIQAHIEELLEDLEEGAIAQSRYEQYKAGIDKGIPWEQIEAEFENDSEEG
jgi:predicted DNA-binding protein